MGNFPFPALQCPNRPTTYKYMFLASNKGESRVSRLGRQREKPGSCAVTPPNRPRHRRSEKRHKMSMRLGALATFSAHACEGSRSSGITQKLDERLHPGTTVHRGTRFILPSIGLTGAPCQCLVGSHIVIWYHTRPRQLTRLSSESSSLHAQPPRCQSGWALTCENALDYTFLDNMWLDTPHVLST
ncbi:unnamed protein product [Microthlaspi erraticum]|uniref:Uncharacterized protein n=1 Tax=Microthlaspi erraticum TaxID=1685480 RepID=A0A6D2KDS3_9BRAS|nr:unnamed protein product [Microthlaspi erraticum]